MCEIDWSLVANMVTAVGTLAAGIAALFAVNKWITEYQGKQLFETIRSAKVTLYRLDLLIADQRSTPLPSKEQAEELLLIKIPDEENGPTALQEEMQLWLSYAEQTRDLVEKLHDYALDIRAMLSEDPYYEFRRLSLLTWTFIREAQRIRSYFSILLQEEEFDFRSGCVDLEMELNTEDILSDSDFYYREKPPNSFTQAFQEASSQLDTALGKLLPKKRRNG